LPGIIAVHFRAFQIILDELPALDFKTPRQPVNLFFTERRFLLPTAVGAGSAIDSSPHAMSGLNDELVDLVLTPVALSLQELPESPVLVLFFLRQLAYLNKIESHIWGCELQCIGASAQTKREATIKATPELLLGTSRVKRKFSPFRANHLIPNTIEFPPK
jgi:hypothetical protein